MMTHYEPYATSHEALDRDTAVMEEVRNATRAVVNGVLEARAGQLPVLDQGRSNPRHK